MERRIAIAGTLLLALLGAPRRTDAGLLEIIWGMSGPQMLGTSFGCLFEIRDFKLDQCRAGGNTVANVSLNSQDPFKSRWFLSLNASAFFSTTKDSETQGYDWGEIWLVGTDPGVVYRSFDYEAAGPGSRKRVQIQHGIGITYHRVIGRHISPFNNAGIVITPIDVRIRKFAFGVKVRLFPDGFTDDQFKPNLPRFVRDRPFEATIGFGGSYVFDCKSKS